MRMELSDILERELQDPRILLVTVTRVKVTPDLSQARVFISTLSAGEERKKALQGLKSASGFVRRSLSGRLHHLRRIPDLIFEYDETLETEMRIEQLFDQIKTKPE